MTLAPPLAPDVRTPPWLKLQRLLGVGGMGKVFEAVDQRSSEVIAVKTLTNFAGKELLCLKNEFRSFANVVHPNLISQYELIENEGQWFLLMELLDGVELLYAVRGETPPPRLHTPLQGSGSGSAPSGTSQGGATTEPSPDRTRTVSTSLVEPAPVVEAPKPPAPATPRRTLSPEERARALPLLRQVALSIDAIHRSGFLHRDIKPSNVMVTTQGRAVLLDFGIAIAKQAAKAETGASDVVVGTPAYLAPELLLSQPASAASDWYSFGVMLYETLSGGRPFGTKVSLRTRLEAVPPPITDFVPDVGEPLAQLTAKLLSIDPSARPTFKDIYLALGGNLQDVSTDSGSNDRMALVGRHEERKRLWAVAMKALEAPTSVFVRGRSGVGKSVLLAEFLAELEAEGRLVLNGRCYEQELVPYKTVDKLVDSLTTELERRREWLPELEPSDLGALTRAFPVLRDVFSKSTGAVQTVADDPAELQRRAIRALTEVFQRLAKKAPLVLCVDDLQWGDVAGAQVLARLAAPSSEPILVVGGFRAEDSASPTLQALGQLFERETGHAPDVMTIEQLSAAESAELAQAMAAEAGVKDPHVVQWALRESEGQAFFLHELLYAAANNADLVRSAGTGLKDVVATRVGQLPADVRRLLEVVCLAGAVLPQEVATSAAGLQYATRLYHQLRASHLIRTTQRDRRDFVDTYHDKFREVVNAGLEGERAQDIHANLVQAYLKAPPEPGRAFTLATHARLAGPKVSPDVVFSVHKDAALEAMAAFDAVRAREFLLTAQDVLRAQGRDLDPELELSLGSMHMATNHIDEAKAAFESVLRRSQDSFVRGGAHSGLARLFMGSLDTRAASAEAGRALRAIGYSPVKSSLLDLVLATFVFAFTLARTRLLGPGRVRPRDELGADLYMMSGYAGYFLFDRKLLLGGLVRGFTAISRLSPGRAKAEAYGFTAVVTSVLGLKGLTHKLIASAQAASTAAHDPAAAAFVAGFSALAVEMGGEILKGEKLGIEAVANGSRQDVSSFLTVVSGVTWSLVMRGQTVRALSVADHGLGRIRSTGDSLIARGHTFRTYFGTIYALQGDFAKAKQALDEYEQFLKQHAADDVFRAALLLGHRALYAQLSAAPDGELEAMFKTHDAYGLSPSSHVQTLRHYYLAKSLRRGDQVLLAPNDAAVRAAAVATVKELKTFKRYLTTTLYRRLLEAKLAVAKKTDVGAELTAIIADARSIEAPWLEFEAILLQAFIDRQAGATEALEAKRRALKALAEEHALAGLLVRARPLLGEG